MIIMGNIYMRQSLINVNKTIKLEFIQNKKKIKKYIIDDYSFDYDDDTIIKLTVYDNDFNSLSKRVLKSLKMIFLALFLMILDTFGPLDYTKSFYKNKYYIENVNDSIDISRIENIKIKKVRRYSMLYNSLYVISGIILLGLLVFLIGSIIYRK